MTALITLVSAGVIAGTGATTNARIRSAATLISSGVRVAFSRAASTSRPVRLVLDLDRQAILLEESSLPMLVRRDDESNAAGAEASTEQEKKAMDEAERIIKGPQAPRAIFKPVKAFGFESDDPAAGRLLGNNVAIKSVEVDHSEKPVLSGRAYIYFWPGGMTERAAIQLGRKDTALSDVNMTVLISPLTGKVTIVGGAKSMEKLRDTGEREDTAF